MSEINSLNTKLLDSLSVIDKAVNVNLANSIWLNNGFEPKESYSNILTGSYYADVCSRDFSKTSTLDEINRWCSTKTNGKVNELLTSLNPDSPMALANAIYFKAPWNVKFSETLSGKFTTVDNTLQDVELFKGKRFARYYSHNKFTAVQLDYGNKAFSYTVVLPTEGVGIDECVKELADGAWDMFALSYIGYSNVTLTMPKYEVDFKISAETALKSLGIEKAFLEGADLSGICDGSSLRVGDVVHACSFKVDKDGTEAAAATAINTLDAAPPVPEREFVVDRPFLFFVQEQSSGAILFVGKVGSI
jgi:serpin B